MKLVQLKCENCGGVLEIDETKVTMGRRFVIVTASEGFTCKHCGAKYVKDSDLAIYKGGGIVNSVAGGDIIGGSGNVIIKPGGDYIIGNKNVIATKGSISIGGDIIGDIIL